MAVVAQESHRKPDTRRVGVRGWLFLFCVELIVIRPFFGALQILMAIGGSGLAHFLAGHPLTALPPLVALAFEVVLAWWSYRAGLRLWNVQPKAVRSAKRFLIANFAGRIVEVIASGIAVSIVAAAGVGFPQSLQGIMNMYQAQGVMSAMLMAVIAYPYLRFSRRVRNTYPS